MGKVLSLTPNSMTKAIQLYEKVLEIDSSVIEAYGAISSCLIKVHEPARAAYWCQKV